MNCKFAPLILIFLSIAFSTAIAQVGVGAKPAYDAFIVNDTLYKYSAGLNTQFSLNSFFDPNASAPIEFILRRQVSLHRAIRLRIFGHSFTEKNERQDFFRTEGIYSGRVGFAIGQEWQSVISRRWKWYFGFEVQAAVSWYDRITREERENDNNQLYEFKSVYNDAGYYLSILPLVGARYHISEKIFLSTEVKLEALFQKLWTQKNDYMTIPDNLLDIVDAGSFSESTTVKYNIELRPYTGIFVNLLL